MALGGEAAHGERGRGREGERERGRERGREVGKEGGRGGGGKGAGDDVHALYIYIYKLYS